MAARFALFGIFLCTQVASGCRACGASQKPEQAHTEKGESPLDGSVGSASDASPVGVADSRRDSSAVLRDAASGETVSVRFHLLDTTTIVMGPFHPLPRNGPYTEPELSVQTGKEKPEVFKVFPCRQGQMERPAFNTCREYETCREFTREQLEQYRSVLPTDTKGVMACARSAKGPAHLLALRVTNDAIVVELSRTDAEAASSLPHPLCKKCPAVTLREWQETRRVPVSRSTTIRVESATRTARTVGVDV